MSQWKKYDETTFTDFGSVGETVPADIDQGAGSTIPDISWGNEGSFEKTEPDVSAQGNGWKDETTKFVDPAWTIDTGEQVRPATGWLVCVEGCVKGKDFRLYQGYSYIGRDPEKNQVSIPDMQISGVPSARILYDKDSRRFFINECDGAKNPIYLNDKLFDGRVELAPYDMIKLGSTKLLFVPLCTDKFAWGE